LVPGSPDGFIRAIGYFSGRLKSSARLVQPHYSGPTTELKGGPYNYRYFLIIWTGEMYLGKEALEAFLEGEVFVCSLITDAYIGLDYHPGSDCPYPAIPLNIIMAGVGSGG
jgi:hypothetical protein